MLYSFQAFVNRFEKLVITDVKAPRGHSAIPFKWVFLVTLPTFHAHRYRGSFNSHSVQSTVGCSFKAVLCSSSRVTGVTLGLSTVSLGTSNPIQGGTSLKESILAHLFHPFAVVRSALCRHNHASQLFCDLPLFLLPFASPTQYCAGVTPL
jgi:hypothetical protein